MLIPVLMSSVLGHILADFIFQTNSIATGKQQLKLKFLAKHFLIVFSTTLIILMLKVDPLLALIVSLVIVSIHIIIDIIKALLERELLPKAYVSFLFDQAVHIITLIIVSFIFVKQMTFNDYNIDFMKWISELVSLKDLTGMTETKLVEHYIETLTHIEIYLSILLFFGFGAGIFVGKFLEQLKNFNIEETTFKLGRYIGIFERLIILILAANLQFRAIGLIIAAKSLARHEKLDHQHFAEYYLLGTLLNILIGITGGLLINYLSTML
ncbi:DUF3307 domain-containing protein [Haloplasma contractile]|uniref:DUF3307 domain-containing protein n=1 Tax=Haloplasma contractile SSD-17B TaxID=1033810 RepID=U2FJP0_9MOLU|nr:DUF3307 domain-containing protein [Haloplasma contractile]ERJ13025.1 hypothetical protein HLPCO_000634 [Haloplasma contractile SSD-17B]